MEYQDIYRILPQEIYATHLKEIKGIKLSKREVDILSCLLNGRSPKGIGHLLSISPRTVEVHIRNIMQKLDCTSRESLINLIEEVDSLLILKDYYLKFLTYLAFEKLLKEGSTLNQENITNCLVIYEQGNDHSFFKSFKEHLNLAHISVTLEEQENKQLFSQLTQLSSQDSYIIYAITNPLETSQGNWPQADEQDDTKKEGFSLHLPPKLNNVLVLLPGKTDQRNDIGSPYVFLKEHKSYYSLICHILKQILPHLNLEKIITEFEEKYDQLQKVPDSLPTQTLKEEKLPAKKASLFKQKAEKALKKKWGYILTAVLLVSLCAVLIGFMTNNQKIKSTLHENEKNQQESLVRSDVRLPHANVLLDRSDIMLEIDNKLKGQKGIQTVALVGTGGAGKTTLARHYAYQKSAHVIWEINAETKESLIESFENLAQSLTKTEEDRNVLRELREVKNSAERNEKILHFVKECLKRQRSWILIYDNVEQFSDIQKYFPQDIKAWGEGRVILTTRNANIQNNSHIHQIIPIGVLSKDQKLSLFMQIIHHGENEQLSIPPNKEVIEFLEKIPSFPLDVSVAAYYLKTTKVSYAKYLEHLNQQNSEFLSVQENLLKEAGDYTKTRYSIITLSLKQLIDIHKDFAELLLFMSLLESQNIPKDLLDHYKNDAVVDNLVYHLKKYSLITTDSTTSSIGPTLSIHRSTQAIILSYLTKTLDLEKNKNLIQPIYNTFINYIMDKIEKGDFAKMNLLLGHCITLLNHNNLLTDFMKTSISAELGGLYCYQNAYTKARGILEELLEKTGKNHYSLIAHISIYLGKLYRDIGLLTTP